MAHQAALLFQLQKVDLDLAQHRARLKEIEAKLKGDETVAQAAQALESAQATLKPWQARARDLDLEIRSVTDKAKATDADLYSGRIRNPKALQELQDEIQALKRQQNSLEDNLLEVMLEVEEQQARIDAAQTALANARAAFAGQQTDLIDERGRLEAELVTLDAQRKQKAASIEPSSIAAYDKLRPRFRGQAVALLMPDGCSMCGVEQTSMNVQAVRSDRTLAYCESCGRILANNS